MAEPGVVPAKDYRGSLLEPLGLLARCLREKSESLPARWVSDAESGLRQGRSLGWFSPPTGELGGILLATPRDQRVFSHLFLTEAGSPGGTGRALARTLFANLPKGLRRLDLTISAERREAEAELAEILSHWEPKFRTMPRQRMVRTLEDEHPPELPRLPPGHSFRWTSEFETHPLAALDFRSFEASPDKGLVAETAEDALRLMGEMLRGELGPVIMEGSPAVVRADHPDVPLGLVLSVQQGASSALIADVAVAPEARRFGIATALMCRALRGLLARGMTHVSLWVTCANSPACELYARFGFRVAQREEIFIWEPGGPAPA